MMISYGAGFYYWANDDYGLWIVD